MARMISVIRFGAASLLLAGSVLVLSVSIGGACGMRWASTATAAKTAADCFGFASIALMNNGFTGIQKTNGEVAGTKSGARAAITCFQFGSATTAVIMVVGDNDVTNTSLLDAVRTKISSMSS